MRLRNACATIAALPLMLCACATGPQERIARAEFQCEAGPKLKVAFNLDQKTATVRVDRSKAPPVVLASQNPGAGRNYAAEGYSLVGVGDEITWATPGARPTPCRESR